MTGVEPGQPALRDADVILRPWRPPDASDLHREIQVAQIVRWLDIELPYTLAEANGFVLREIAPGAASLDGTAADERIYEWDPGARSSDGFGDNPPSNPSWYEPRSTTDEVRLIGVLTTPCHTATGSFSY